MNAEKEKLTLLDRRKQILLEHPDLTPSTKKGISPSLERLHRLHGTSLILDASRLLSFKASTFATACTIFHRFYHQISISEYDVWSVAMSSLLLATKLEEEPQTLRSIVNTFASLYRKRTLFSREEPEFCILEKHPSIAYYQICTNWNLSDKQNCLKKLSQVPNIGSVYTDWHDQLSQMESIILRQLGFSLYWIPSSHPHQYVLYFLGVLKLDTSEFAQRAWDYCNDSCRLDLCVRFPAEVIASSCILLASRDLKIRLPSNDQPWWELFIGSNQSYALATAANLICGLSKLGKDEEAHRDVLLANKGFVKSLMASKSFNDPESNIWDDQGEVVKSIHCEFND